MISVYKFGLFTTYKVDARVVTEFGMSNRPVKYSFKFIYRDRNNQMVVPVPKKIEVVPNLYVPHTGKNTIHSLNCELGIQTNEEFLQLSKQWIKSGIHILGGCCRTTPELIQTLSNAYHKQ